MSLDDFDDLVDYGVYAETPTNQQTDSAIKQQEAAHNAGGMTEQTSGPVELHEDQPKTKQPLKPMPINRTQDGEPLKSHNARAAPTLDSPEGLQATSPQSTYQPQIPATTTKGKLRAPVSKMTTDRQMQVLVPNKAMRPPWLDPALFS